VRGGDIPSIHIDDVLVWTSQAASEEQAVTMRHETTHRKHSEKAAITAQGLYITTPSTIHPVINQSIN
jgi:hypothetical protein